MYRRGVNVSEIAEKLELSMSSIYRIIRSRGLSMRRGSYKSRGRISREELEKIVEMRRKGKSIYEIAKRLDRPPSTIFYVLKRHEEKS